MTESFLDLTCWFDCTVGVWVGIGMGVGWDYSHGEMLILTTNTKIKMVHSMYTMNLLWLSTELQCWYRNVNLVSNSLYEYNHQC